MRGKEETVPEFYGLRGITPAYAGKSCLVLCKWSCNWDHPRVCGEKCELVFGLVAHPGSPPRMRGKERFDAKQCDRNGITPAYAGKSLKTSWARTTKRDHPRVCGEKNALPAAFVVGEGSPPRMRGKEMLTTPSSVAMRITPAYAGKRAPFQKMSTASRDHPRVCGEKTHGTRGLARPSGSPPRMRGKERSACRVRSWRGITPAYAGKRNVDNSE